MMSAKSVDAFPFCWMELLLISVSLPYRSCSSIVHTFIKKVHFLRLDSTAVSFSNWVDSWLDYMYLLDLTLGYLGRVCDTIQLVLVLIPVQFHLLELK